MRRLSQDLQLIYDLEIRLGNQVESVDEPAGSTCPFAVNFRDRLHTTEISGQISLPESVNYFENHDNHYPLQNGYQSTITGHVVAGPLPAARARWV